MNLSKLLLQNQSCYKIIEKKFHNLQQSDKSRKQKHIQVFITTILISPQPWNLGSEMITKEMLLFVLKRRLKFQIKKTTKSMQTQISCYRLQTSLQPFALFEPHRTGGLNNLAQQASRSRNCGGFGSPSSVLFPPSGPHLILFGF